MNTYPEQTPITPFRLGLALTATCASHRVETLADFHRGFNALFDLDHRAGHSA